MKKISLKYPKEISKFKNEESKLKYLNIFIMKKFLFLLYFLKLYFCKNNTINIAMTLDNNYVYPTIVSITSIMLNSNPFSYIHIFIMHSPEFKFKNKKKLLSLEKKFVKCKINLINMGKKYKKANKNKLITTPTYYRL